MATLDNNNIFTLGKGKTPASTNDIETYNKETLGKEIRKLITTNTQLMNDKLNTKAVKTKLEADKAKLINEKNILVVKREELQAELTETAAAPTTNAQILTIIVYNKLKAKRPPPFNETKETLQRFFIKTRYYHRFYNQNLPFDSDKIQNAIVNIVGNALK